MNLRVTLRKGQAQLLELLGMLRGRHTEARPGTLPSRSWTLLVAHFLQNFEPPILPIWKDLIEMNSKLNTD
jgi:hypothetical protein